jgi:hypothetical protein
VTTMAQWAAARLDRTHSWRKAALRVIIAEDANPPSEDALLALLAKHGLPRSGACTLWYEFRSFRVTAGELKVSGHGWKGGKGRARSFLRRSA